MDKAVIERAVQQIIEAIGEDPKREGLIGTPRRIADMDEGIFAGLKEDPRELLEVGFDDEEHHELVIVKDNAFYCLCEAPFLPFYGGSQRRDNPVVRIPCVS